MASLHSMTGYGSALLETDTYTSKVELKSVNAKFFDCNLHIPRLLQEKEYEIRNLLSSALERGTVSLSIRLDWKNNAAKKLVVNEDLFFNYFQKFEKLAQNVSSEYDVFRIALNQPEVLKTEEREWDENWWSLIKNTIEEAITELQNFRANEGKKIQEVLVKNVKEIEINQDKLAQYESNRLENMRHKLDDLFSKYKVDQSIDKSRLEQELVYYIEKYDIQEEKNRLMSHCQFFIETIGENPKGKKLGFICQEMGREINTIGSKANYAEIQKNVVLMKENLEQMKEQIMNIV
ncbi:MAG: YicC family protein [Bacteroidetes bacterium MED-G17]|nr:MAG: YicC family protein [Bacteroidetes bacterium MED-G17]CAI8362594.1 MAG: Uncharacterised protein [Bacteroidetes bacterium MED-G17]|tara:strand:- start:31341 stop:32216 length:876 start_codon:yes stop_codon:yes gene_type:complete